MPADLRMVTDEVLNVPLHNITNINSNMETMTFELINWAMARGRMTELEHVPSQLNRGDSRGVKDERVYRH